MQHELADNSSPQDPPAPTNAGARGRPQGAASDAGGGALHRRRRRFPLVQVVAVCVIALLVFAALFRGRGIKTWVMRQVFPTYGARPTVTATRPGDFSNNVLLDAFVAADVNLPNDGRIIDPKTLPPHKPGTVRLLREGDDSVVAANVNTTGGGDAIVLVPAERLEPNTQYTFEVTPGVQDTGGAPFEYFKSSFTTAGGSEPQDYPAAFTKVALPTTAGNLYSCVAVGPDRRLYASSVDGRILRFDINPDDGTLSAPATFGAIAANNGGPRLVIGFCFDPKSTPDAPVLWVSHGQLAGLGDNPKEIARDWTGKISRLSGRDLSRYEDVVIHLPRGVNDHLNNQPAFGPDGALYFAQASNSAMGAPDPKWGMRPERLLGAAILRLDVSRLAPGGPPLDARTEHERPADGGPPLTTGPLYDPYAPDAPLTIYATGIRNGYDLLFHSGGRFYAPINASAAGGRTPGSHDPRGANARRPDTGKPYAGPTVPALPDVPYTMEDTLLLVEHGAYYGHPNPLRGEFVLKGGNPTPGPDPGEIPAYPVGTAPDPNFRHDSYSFGKNLSPCGIIEYKSDGPLKGKILVARYSGGDDVIVLSPDGPGGAITESLTGIDGLNGFRDPLDLTEDPRNGNLYVAEFSANQITLVRPVNGGVSHRAFRQDAAAAGPATRAGVKVK
jgi:hypothetical protein